MKKLTISIIGILCAYTGFAQLVINEVAYRNPDIYADNFGSYPGWIELHNYSLDAVFLGEYSINDEINSNTAWPMPQEWLPAGGYRLIYASKKDQPAYWQLGVVDIDHWESLVSETDTCRYFEALPAVPIDWAQLNFVDLDWFEATGPIGYGDGDDATLLPNDWFTTYARYPFEIVNPSQIASLVLHIDYDDGFVAYLNGVEIARRNLNYEIVKWYDYATDHEAVMYAGGAPETIELDYLLIQSLLQSGSNVLAFEVHNSALNDDDQSLRAWLQAGMKTTEVVYDPTPSWFIDPASQVTYPYWHTNFKLDEGETVTLFNQAGILVDSLTLAEVLPGHVQARVTDGPFSWILSTNPTPNAANPISNCCLGYTDNVIFSLPGGFYNEQIIVSATTDTGQLIRFTLDGSIPTAQDPLLQPAGILLEAGQVHTLRARAFAPGLISGKTETANYAIQINSALPVVFLTTDSLNLFDLQTGIYMLGDTINNAFPFFGANFWQEWKRPVHLAYFESDTSSLGFDANLSISINGGWSRACDQKGFSLEADGDFGAKDIDYPIFAEKPWFTTYQQLNLRNSGNDHNQTHYREVLNQRIGQKTEVDEVATGFASVYINGNYWGVYQVIEPHDDEYLVNNFTANLETADLIRIRLGTQEAQVGSLSRINTLFALIDTLNLGEQSNCTQIMEQEFDELNYYDYLFNGIYGGNWDWISWGNNTKLWHPGTESGRWRHILWDNDFSFGFGYENILAKILDDTIASDYELMTRKILQSPWIQHDFINRSCDLMNTVYRSDSLILLTQSLKQTIEPEMAAQIERWPLACWTGFTTFENWQQNAGANIESFINNRSPVIREQFINTFGKIAPAEIELSTVPEDITQIEISTLTINNFPWAGKYIEGNTVPIKVNIPLGYTFTGWFLNDNFWSTDLQIEINPNNLTNLVAYFEPIIDYVPDTPKIAITELNYHADPTANCGDWIEIYNYSATDTAFLNGCSLVIPKTGSTTLFNAEAFILPLGRLVVVADEGLFLSQYSSNVAPWHVAPNLQLTESSDTISIFSADGNLLTQAGYSSLLPWPQCTNGHGRTLERTFLDYSASPLASNHWKDGCMFGSPGTAFIPCQQTVVFNEIMYKPALATDGGDWIELATNTPIDLSNWSVTDQGMNSPFIFPQGTNLEPDQYLVVANNAQNFTSMYGYVQPPGYMDFGLSGAGDLIKLYDASGRIFLSMHYLDDAPWPNDPDGTGPSLRLNSLDLDVNTFNSWSASCLIGSPGLPNDTCVNATVPTIEFAQKSKFLIYPNPTTGLLQIEANSPIEHWTVYNILGVICQDSYQVKQPDLSALPAGSYLIEVMVGNQLERAIVLKE
jgi:CotH kinase protein/Lamin Tail Domain/Secretion system C-terminal sorting domain/Chitobiase/beta-hexosaminidase C-terminal domain